MITGTQKNLKLKKLNRDHENLKQEIDDNQKKYENLIDEAADQISNFVKKAKLKIYQSRFVSKSKAKEEKFKS